MDGQYPRSLGYQQITSLSSATGLTIPEGTTYAIIQAEAQGVRWRDDGTDPTSSVGMKLPADAELQYSGQFARIKFIELTASAALNITYYGE